MDVSWFGCNFCSFKSSTKSEQSEHIRQHFNQKFCSGCDKSLIQIGDNWYELKFHADENCNGQRNLEGDEFYGNNVKNEPTQEFLDGSCSPPEKHLIDEDANHLVLNILSNDCQYFAEESFKPETIQNLEIVSNDCNTIEYSDRSLDTTSYESNSTVNNDVSLNADKKNVDTVTNKNTVMITSGSVKSKNTFKPRKCVHCEKVLITNAGYYKHLRVKHNIIKTYKCEACDEKFLKLVLLSEHVKAAHNGKPFQCQLCPKKFIRKAILTRHVGAVHGICADGTSPELFQKKVARPKPCQYCAKKLLTYRGITLHMLKEHNVKNTFRCGVCDQVFDKQPKRTQHIKETHAGYAHKCKVCNRLFRKVNALKTHAHLHNQPVTCSACNKELKPIDDDDEPIGNRKRKKYKCETCKEASKVQSEQEVGQKSEAAENDVTENASTNAELNQTKTKFSKTCEHCGKLIKSPANYYKHLRGKHGIRRRHDCFICTVPFDKLVHLTAHINAVHDGKRYPCGQCDETFRHRSKRDRHFHVHTQHLNHIVTCDICGKQYKGKDTIRGHMKIHMQREKFKCELCEKHFSNENSLKVHIKVRHEEIVSFECRVCGKSLSTKAGLKTHEETHSDFHRYICDYCGHGFHAKSNLSEHINLHTGEKPYACKFCEKTFPQNIQLIAHTRIHTRERPYKCKIGDCTRAYINAVDLKRHRYSTHGVYTKKHTCHLCPKFFMEKKLLRKHLESH